VEAELGQGVYLQDRVKGDMERVDPLTVMGRVGVLNIIQKVSLSYINLSVSRCLSLISALNINK